VESLDTSDSQDLATDGVTSDACVAAALRRALEEKVLFEVRVEVEVEVEVETYFGFNIN
jgi:hypothetical protein